MYYYAFVDENGICTSVFEVAAAFSGDGYVEITKEMYEDPGTIGRKYENGEWESTEPVPPDLGYSVEDISEMDLDNLIKCGIFFGSGMENAPGDGFYYIVNIPYPDGYNVWRKQIAMDFTSNSTLTRTKADGTWTEWE